MFRRFMALPLLLMIVVGCAEGQKPNPLPRAKDAPADAVLQNPVLKQ